jgi:hypothetical protein
MVGPIAGTRGGIMEQETLKTLTRQWIVAVALALTFLAAIGVAEAQTGKAAPPPNSWAGQLETLARWLDQHGDQGDCHERCYVLDRLRMSGSVEEGTFEFELEGAVLAEGPVAVPLFGPPSQVRIDQATEADRPARIGFEGSSYFLFTDSRQFTLRGRLTLQGDLAIQIPGPLNTLEADLEGGRLVEGARLSGLSDATIHFERGSGAEEPEEPTVFQLSRAIRVGREVGFEYRLVMRSGGDLGVVRLPLRHGEEVLEVQGSSGWRAEGGELILPTSGRTAEVTISGTMPEVGTFSPDGRSSYEWWLLESDPEHRLTVNGSGRQFDVGESPIERTEQSSRLFMVGRGQQLEVSVERLTSAEVLGAVVRSHDRTVVLTRRGDLISQDHLEYENNGIDYLLYSPEGRATYLAADGLAERIMHKAGETRELMIPLRAGAHNVKIQALSHTSAGLLGGRLVVPTPTYPLTASRATVTLGLPEHVHPVAAFGGDRIEWFVGLGDLAAALFGVLLAWVFLHRRRGWVLGGAALAGLWFLSNALYVLVVAGLAIAAAIWALSRFVRGGKLVAAIAGVAVAAMVAMLVLISLLSVRGGSEYASPYPSSGDWAREQNLTLRSDGTGRRGAADGLGNRLAQNAEEGLLEGVTPVALPLPDFHRSVTLSRELVTEERAFCPTVYYVTTWALLPFAAFWLFCLVALVWLNRLDLMHLKNRVSARLAEGPPPEPQVTKPPIPSTAATDDREEPSSRSQEEGVELAHEDKPEE